MKFRILLVNENDIIGKNASFSLGWFEIIYAGTNISLFKERFCMIFLTLNPLIDYLLDYGYRKSYNNKKYGWDAVDDSSVVYLCRKKSYLEIYSNEIMTTVVFEDFKKAVLQNVMAFLADAVSINPDINNEGAYIDLQNSLSRQH